MSSIIMSDSAYNEFKKLLDDNEVSDYTIRINFAGMSCHGPSFNISPDSEAEGDLVEKIHDITFLVKKDLVSEFEGFEITSSEENGRGLLLEPVKKFEGGGCSGCSGGCH